MSKNMKDINGDPNVNCYWSVDNYEVRKCPQCHQEYKHYPSNQDWVSDFDKKVLCSYNCRCAYYKEHAAKRKKWLAENSSYNKYLKITEKKQKYNNKYYERKKKGRNYD